MENEGQDLPIDSAPEIQKEPGEVEAHQEEPKEQDDLSEGVKARLGRQEKKHQKELRQIRAQMEEMQAHISARPPERPLAAATDPYTGTPYEEGTPEFYAHAGAKHALEHLERQNKAREAAEEHARVAEKFRGLADHLDEMEDKYEDYHDVVRDNRNTDFTDVMRSTGLVLPKSGPGSAGETFYVLGKNKAELKRISRLPHLEQMSELIALSQSLAGGHKESLNSPAHTRPIGNIKTTPVSRSSSINENTPIRELRNRMKAGWK